MLRLRSYHALALVALVLWGVVAARSSPATTRGITIIASDQRGKLQTIPLYRKMFGVVIGIDRYSDRKIRSLDYAVKDARGVRATLKAKFAFDEVYEVVNDAATRQGIFDAIIKTVGKQVTSEDAVFIFFAGHGFTIPSDEGAIGGIVPFDGTFDEDDALTRNISMADFRDNISAKLNARHIFYVFDACYGGTLLRSGATKPPPRNLDYLRERARERVRQALTAGSANEQVLDDGRGGHSVFTGRFIERLESTEDFLTAEELSVWISERVFSDAQDRHHKQTPQHGKLTGLGDFVFVPKAGPGSDEGSSPRSDEPVEPTEARPLVVMPLPDRTPPVIALDPVPSSVTEKSLLVSGRVSDRDDRDAIQAIPSLTADGTDVRIGPNGKFSVRYTLTEGNSTLVFTARDAAGNESKSTAEVKYAPARVEPASVPQVTSPSTTSRARLPSGFSAVSTATDPASGLPMRIRHEKTGIELVLVAAGEFAMGYDWIATPIHTVVLDAYYIGVTEVTNAQFRKFRAEHTSKEYSGQSLNGDNQPVVNVSWNDAKAYCDWAGLALPTEAQWEKAARGTDGRKFPWGNQWPPPRGAGNFADATAKRTGVLTNQIDGYDDGNAATSPVGTFGANEPYGTRDMAGNVWEWCADWYGDYPAGTVRNPTGPTSGTSRVLRGAGWIGVNASNFAAAYRNNGTPGILNYVRGFRVSCVVRQD